MTPLNLFSQSLPGFPICNETTMPDRYGDLHAREGTPVEFLPDPIYRHQTHRVRLSRRQYGAPACQADS